jgi:hypothetical protein
MRFYICLRIVASRLSSELGIAVLAHRVRVGVAAEDDCNTFLCMCMFSSTLVNHQIIYRNSEHALMIQCNGFISQIL